MIDIYGYASRSATAVGAMRGKSSGETIFIPNPIVALVNIGPNYSIREVLEVSQIGTNAWVQYGINDKLFRDKKYDILSHTNPTNYNV